MKNYRYQAFGLTISSDIEFDNILPAKKYTRSKIKIIQGKIDKNGLKSPVIKNLHFQTSPDKLWLRVPDVGLFLISNGSEIKYQKDPKADIKTLSLFLLGTCMVALLHQRGFIVLHAMAFKYNNEAIVVSGVSGTGKTTLAAVMHKQGYKILTDDICVIDSDNKVQPGYPALKLWANCFRVMEIKPGTLKKIRPQIQKYLYKIDKGFSTKALPVKSVYMLNSWNKDAPELESINGVAKLMPLRSQIFCLQYLVNQDLKQGITKKLAQLANKINLARVTRPQSNYKVLKLIDFIINDIKNDKT